MVFNRKMLTVEDTNSIIQHFGRNLNDWYELDTRVLSDNAYYAYDFVTVIKSEGEIILKVNNNLWTGGFVITCNISNYTLNYDDNIITVSGTGLEWIKVLLEISTDYNFNGPVKLDFQTFYEHKIIPFYEQPEMVVLYGTFEDEPVVNLKVGDDYTDGSGAVTLEAPLQSAGDYSFDCIVYPKTVFPDAERTTMNYNYPYTVLKAELPVILVNEKLYIDKVNNIKFKFLFDETYNITDYMLFNDNEILLKVNNKEYEMAGGLDGGFGFNVPVTALQSLKMELIIKGNDYLEDYTLTFSKNTEYISFDNVADLKTELNNSNTAGTILFTGNELDEEITINKDVVLQFDADVTSSLDNVFTVSDGASLTLQGLDFSGNQLVKIIDGEVNAKYSHFQHSIGTLFTGDGNLNIDDCGFIDNETCININGDLNIYNTVFELSDNTYLDTKTAAFITCYKDININYCTFNINLTGLTSLGLSYVMLFIGKDSIVNKTPANNLLENEKFPMQKNTSDVNIESTHYHITSKNNKCMIWTVEETNTVYSNNMEVQYVQ